MSVTLHGRQNADGSFEVYYYTYAISYNLRGIDWLIAHKVGWPGWNPKLLDASNGEVLEVEVCPLKMDRDDVLADIINGGIKKEDLIWYMCHLCWMGVIDDGTYFVTVKWE